MEPQGLDLFAAAMGKATVMCELVFVLARPAPMGADVLHLKREYEQGDVGEFVPLRKQQVVFLFDVKDRNFTRMITDVGEGTIRLNEPIVCAMLPDDTVVRPMMTVYSSE